MPQTTLDEVVAYLWEHGATHSFQGLRDHLVAQGYDPALIDQAVATYRAERAKLDGAEPEAEISPPPAGGGHLYIWGALLVGILVALGNGGFLFLALREAAASFSGADTHPQLTESRIGVAVNLGLKLFLWEVWGGLLLLALGLVPGPLRPFGRGLGGGLLLGILLTGLLLLIGIGVCFVVLSGGGR